MDFLPEPSSSIEILSPSPFCSKHHTTYHVLQLQLILALISVSKQSNVLGVSCLVCVDDAAFLVPFLRVECLHDVVFFSLPLYTKYARCNSIIGFLDKSLGLSSHQKRTGCNSSSLAVAQVCEFLLYLRGYCNF